MRQHAFLRLLHILLLQHQGERTFGTAVAPSVLRGLLEGRKWLETIGAIRDVRRAQLRTAPHAILQHFIPYVPTSSTYLNRIGSDQLRVTHVWIPRHHKHLQDLHLR